MGIEYTYTCDICKRKINFPKEQLGTIEAKMELENNESREDRRERTLIFACVDCADEIWTGIKRYMAGEHR